MKVYEDIESMIRFFFPKTQSIKFHDAFGSGLSGVSSTPGLATVSLDNGDKAELFLKVCKKGSNPYLHNTLAKTMEKEIFFYESILPKMIAFEEAKGLKDATMRIEQHLPKYYGGGTVREGDIILILENIQKMGFKAVGAKEFHSLEQVKLSIEAIAVFHAISYGMKVLDGFDWTSVPNLFDYIHSVEHEDVYSVFHLDMNKHYLRLLQIFVEEKDSSEIVRKNLSRFCSPELLSELQKLQPNIFKILRRCRSPVEPQGVLCHGDYHMWNVAFDENSTLMMFDFQILCYASAMTDLHYFLSQSTTPATRNEHRREFLQLYSETFTKVGKALGIPLDQLEPFSLENVEKEFKERSSFNYVFGLHYFTIRLMEDKEKFGTTREMTDHQEIIRTIDECGPKTWEIFQHAFDLVNETQEMGTLEVMKEWIKKY